MMSGPWHPDSSSQVKRRLDQSGNGSGSDVPWWLPLVGSPRSSAPPRDFFPVVNRPPGSNVPVALGKEKGGGMWTSESLF